MRAAVTAALWACCYAAQFAAIGATQQTRKTIASRSKRQGIAPRQKHYSMNLSPQIATSDGAIARALATNNVEGLAELLASGSSVVTPSVLFKAFAEMPETLNPAVHYLAVHVGANADYFSVALQLCERFGRVDFALLMSQSAKNDAKSAAALCQYLTKYKKDVAKSLELWPSQQAKELLHAALLLNAHGAESLSQDVAVAMALRGDAATGMRSLREALRTLPVGFALVNAVLDKFGTSGVMLALVELWASLQLSAAQRDGILGAIRALADVQARMPGGELVFHDTLCDSRDVHLDDLADKLLHSLVFDCQEDSAGHGHHRPAFTDSPTAKYLPQAKSGAAVSISNNTGQDSADNSDDAEFERLVQKTCVRAAKRLDFSGQATTGLSERQSSRRTAPSGSNSQTAAVPKHCTAPVTVLEQTVRRFKATHIWSVAVLCSLFPKGDHSDALHGASVKAYELVAAIVDVIAMAEVPDMRAALHDNPVRILLRLMNSANAQRILRDNPRYEPYRGKPCDWPPIGTTV